MPNVGRLLEVMVIVFFISRVSMIAKPRTSLERSQLKQLIALKKAEVAALSEYHDLDTPLSKLNFTNVRPYETLSKDNYDKFLPPEIKMRVDEIWNAEPKINSSVFYKNMSSYMKGAYNTHGKHTKFWNPEPMPIPIPGFEDIIETPQNNTPADLSRRLGQKGTISVNLYQGPKVDGIVRLISGSISLGTSNLAVEMKGIYLDHGHIIMATESLKFAGAAALPYLLPTNDSHPEAQESMQSARRLILEHVNDTVTRIEERMDYEYMEASFQAAQSCESILFGHIHSSTGLSSEQLQEIEEELENPLGRPVPPFPPVQMDAVIWSPDCGLDFDIKAKGERAEYYTSRARKMLTFLLVNFICISLLSASLARENLSPSRACRISFWTLASFSITDGLIAMVSLIVSAEPTYALVSAAISIMALLQTSMFDIKLMASVYSSQRTEDIFEAASPDQQQLEQPEQPEQLGQPGQPGSNANETVEQTDTETETSTDDQEVETNERSATPERSPAMPESLSDQTILAMIYSRYYASITFLLLVTLIFFSMGDRVRIAYESCIILILYSYWIPQIWRNARRGSPVPFSKKTIVSMTFLRLWPILYMCFIKNNIGYHRHAPRLGYTVLIWQIVQAAIILTQSMVGSRFFLRGSFASIPGYNYHILLTEDIESMGDAAEAPQILIDRSEETPSEPQSEPQTETQTDMQTEGGAETQTETATESGANNETANQSGHSVTRTVTESATIERRYDEELHTMCKYVPCAICMSEVRLPIVKSVASATPAILLEREMYMITPCRHIFHTECLEQWLQSRLQCPICRCAIPPVQG